jgi:predicted methyltransferase
MLLAFAPFLLATAASTPNVDPALAAAVAAPTRTPANMARDRHRHPAETLSFFGVKPNQTVVEVWPAGGWYAEILAPYLAKRGTYYAGVPSERGQAGIKKLQAEKPGVYDKVRFTTFPVAAGQPVVPAGTADVVLTFRNVHNWSMGETDRAQDAFNQMFAMLKPGGTLGVVEHRLPENQAGITEAKSGYMKRSTVLAYATKAGFKLAGESEINANPKDTHDYPKGCGRCRPITRRRMWTAPATPRSAKATA